VRIWLAILVVSVALGALFAAIGLPAPWLLGPLLAGLVFGCSPLETQRVPRPIFICAQVVVGLVLAGGLRPSFLGTIATHWWLLGTLVTATVAAAASSAWFLIRTTTLPAVTATLGMMPAGAATMTGLAVDLDADPRVVAFLQYMRIILAISTVSLVARFFFHVEWHAPVAVSPTVPLSTLAITLTVGAVAATLAWYARLPGAPVLGPLIVGGALSIAGLVKLELPAALLDLSYVVMGLFIGLRFTIHSVLYVMSMMGRMLAANVWLLVVCAFIGTLLTKFAHIDPLTAYLATSPGGMDAIAVIAIGGGADVGTVVLLQVTRSFLVTACGPLLVRLVAARTGRYSAAASSS
jgi:membrane AbrB-like protein